MTNLKLHDIEKGSEHETDCDVVVFKAKSKDFVVSDKLSALAKKVMEDKKLDLSPAELQFLLVYPNISKKRPARVKLATPELTFFTNIDYLVEFSGDLWDMLDADSKYNLMWNQLLRIDPVFKTKTGEWTFKICKPEYSDFYGVMDNIGNEWHRTIQAVSSSLYDLPPKEENQVSLF